MIKQIRQDLLMFLCMYNFFLRYYKIYRVLFLYIQTTSEERQVDIFKPRRHLQNQHLTQNLKMRHSPLH